MPWSNQRNDLILLQEDVSGFSGLFGYSPRIGAGNLIFSLTAAAGTDPYGNAYPAGLSVTGANSTLTGTDYIINSVGAFFYSNTPAAGNLIASIVVADGTDGFGNHCKAGVATYSATDAVVVAGASISFYSGSRAAGWTAQGVVGINAGNDLSLSGGSGAKVIANSPFTVNAQAALMTGGLTVTGGETADEITVTARMSAPSAPASGTTVYADSAGKLVQIPQAGTPMQVPGAQLATFPGTTVTQASLTNLATATIPANDAEAGSVYELEVEGSFTQALGTATTLQLGAALGGIDNANQILASGFATAGGTGRFRARVRAYCVTPGVTGTWRTSVLAEVTPNANPNGTVTICDSSAGATITVDTTANQVLALRAAWGTTAGTPSIINRETVPKRVA